MIVFNNGSNSKSQNMTGTTTANPSGVGKEATWTQRAEREGGNSKCQVSAEIMLLLLNL